MSSARISSVWTRSVGAASAGRAGHYWVPTFENNNANKHCNLSTTEQSSSACAGFELVDGATGRVTERYSGHNQLRDVNHVQLVERDAVAFVSARYSSTLTKVDVRSGERRPELGRVRTETCPSRFRSRSRAPVLTAAGRRARASRLLSASCRCTSCRAVGRVR